MQAFQELGENPNPKIPETLLEKPTSLPVEADSEFNKTEIHNGVSFPKYACCRIEDLKCTIIILGPRAITISGNLADQLPRVKFPVEEKPRLSLWNPTTWKSIWESIPARIVIECNRPPLGNETKSRIAKLTSQDWENMHLVWPAENNWHQIEARDPRPEEFKKTEMLVVGETSYEFRIIAKIDNRAL